MVLVGAPQIKIISGLRSTKTMLFFSKSGTMVFLNSALVVSKLKLKIGFTRKALSNVFIDCIFKNFCAMHNVFITKKIQKSGVSRVIEKIFLFMTLPINVRQT